jgi:serine/threonine-protein kinase mTOR
MVRALTTPIAETLFVTLGHVLNEFVRDCAIPYLEHEQSEVRQAAAFTCCRLFARDSVTSSETNQSIEVINDVLEKLLTVGIADSGRINPSLRSLFLTILDRRSGYSPNCPFQSRRKV